MTYPQVAAIVLAAGKGKRINAKEINKTMLFLANKPMVAYTIENLEKLKLGQIIMVVGFAREATMNFFKKRIDYAWQKKRLGTGHAVGVGLKKVKPHLSYILVSYGDDSAFYPVKILTDLIKVGSQKEVAFAFLTLKKKDPTGLGRVVRDQAGQLLGIVEEKNATPSQLRIKEINAGTYCLKRQFLEKYLPKIKKNPVTGEYYITDLVDLALKDGLKVETVALPSEAYWHGVNTKEQLLEADQKMRLKLLKNNVR